MIDREDWELIGDNLEDYHSLFYRFWYHGIPSETKDIPTAAIQFNKKGKYVNFLFNPEFWDKSTDYERQFVVSHEMLHLILNHGTRMIGLNRDVCNIAMDVVVNEMLIDYFGFERDKISFSNTLCFLDTVFGKNGYELDNVLQGQNFEYYYNLIFENATFIDVSKYFFPDDSSFFEGSNTSRGEIEKAFGKLDEDATDEMKELEDQDGNPNAPAGAGMGWWSSYGEIEVILKMSWETLFKKFFWENTEVDHEQWARADRRFHELPDDLILPSDYETIDVDKDKIAIWLFLDVSGSCSHLRDRFLKAYKSIPQNKFEIELFSFDTMVHPVDKKNQKIYGGGGTSFSTIESYIKDKIRNDRLKYPKIVMLFTDGCGNEVNPLYPERWYWFLSEGMSSYIRYYIPKNSNHYNLTEFE